jgi:uncharacterized protein
VLNVVITINLKSKIDFKDHSLITGFHGIGVTGYIATRHVVETLEAEYLGYIKSDLAPPFIGMDEDRLVFPFEFYKHKDLIFLLNRFQPQRSEQREFSMDLSNWIIENKFKQTILIGGLDNRFQRDEDEFVRCVFTKKSGTDLELFNLKKLEKGLFVTGPLAIMLSNFEINNFPCLALLPYAEQGRPDPRAASRAVQIISKIFNLNIDTIQLITDAEAIENELKEVIEQEEIREDEGHKGMYV